MAASKLTNEDKLKRLIYLSNVEPKYISGDPDKYVPISKLKLDILYELVRNTPENFVNIIISANGDKLVPRRSTLFHLLACALICEGIPGKTKSDITKTALNICKSDTEFFDFIKYVTTLNNRKLMPCVRKIVSKFYAQKSAADLAYSFVTYNRYHSWSHKDLIKLGHVKFDDVKNSIVKYILFKKTEAEGHDATTNNLINHMRKSDILRKTNDHKVAVPIISELKANINQVEPSLRKSAEIWNAVLPNMSLSEILQVLPKLYKLGFLKKDSPTQAIINEALTNSEKIKNSGIHPIEIFIHMKNFEKGGKPLDPKLLEYLIKVKKLSQEEVKKIKTPKEAKCPVILSNLQKCMNISCSNIQSFGKRYMITIDTTDKMDSPCMHNKNITGLEAAMAFTTVMLRTEKDVTVAVYKEKEITLVQLDKKGQYYEHVQKLKEHTSSYLVPSAPIDWAASHKKHVDIFFNFIHHKEFYGSIPKDVREKMVKPVEALQKYRKKYNLQNAKLVTFCMSSPHVVIADGSHNILDVAGLDLGVPRLVEAFCRGNFS